MQDLELLEVSWNYLYEGNGLRVKKSNAAGGPPVEWFP